MRLVLFIIKVATNDFHPQKDKVRDQNYKTKKKPIMELKIKIVSKNPKE